MRRMTIWLEDDERETLGKMALEAMRSPQDQARWLLRQQLRAACPALSMKGDEVNDIDHEREGR